MEPGNRRAVFASLAANLGIATAKFVGYVLTGAASLLAETVHSLADTGNQVLLLWGSTAAAREPTETHPFGYGRERYFWAFVVALVIFSLGALFAMAEGIDKLRHPHELSNPIVAIGILVAAMGLEGFALFYAAKTARKVKGALSWWAFIRGTKNPELPVLLLEDFGAMCGLALALGGVLLAMATGDPRWDAAGSIAIGALLAVIAVILAIEMKSLLIGEAASPEDQARIDARLTAMAEVRRIIHMRTQHMGPDQLLVGAKIEFDGGLSFRQLSDAIDRVEAEIRAVLPIATVIYIEPDIYDAREDTRLGATAETDRVDDPGGVTAK